MPQTFKIKILCAIYGKPTFLKLSFEEYMPFFVVTCTDNDDVLEKRLEIRPEHIKRLEKLNNEGRLITAGALPKDPNNIKRGFYGSILIVEFNSREDLDKWLKDEPFLREKVYSNIDVKIFNKAFPIS